VTAWKWILGICSLCKVPLILWRRVTPYKRVLIDLTYARNACVQQQRSPFLLRGRDNKLSFLLKRGLLADRQTDLARCTKMHTSIQAAAKHPRKLIAIFSATAWNFNATFHTLISGSYLHKWAKQHLILSYCCEVTECLRDNIVILHIQCCNELRVL